MKNKSEQFKNGFTLAEVLITLVIIGVIAALTIPTAINNTKEQELKSQFAKAYSTVSQAIYKTEMNDFYGYAKCYYGNSGLGGDISECASFFNAFVKNLQIQKVCSGNSLSGGCIPEYQSYANNGGCNGFFQDAINVSNYAYVLSNGQIIILYTGAAYPLFLVDINGHKGPNAYGKDLFSFQLERNSDTGIYSNKGNCEFRVQGGKTTTEMIQYSLIGKK